MTKHSKLPKQPKAAKQKNTKNTTTVKDVTGEELLAPFKNQETLTREEFAQTAAEYLAYKDELTVASIKSKTKAKEYKPNIVVAPDEVNFPDERKSTAIIDPPLPLWPAAASSLPAVTTITSVQLKTSPVPKQLPCYSASKKV